MELSNIKQIEDATRFGRPELFRLGIGIIFIAGVMLFTDLRFGNTTDNTMLIVAAMIGGYMAMNIGANDVANNVGPAVGSKALTLTGAILLAVVFEGAGALIAGGDVVDTIRKGIIDPSLIADRDTFIWIMMAALLAGAVWLNIATAMGAPVSTTHSIVGGVLGAGIAAGGIDIANWNKVAAISASWVISPVLGGLIAAGFLYLIKRTITYQSDMTRAAKRVVPLLVALMVMAFSTYLILKGLKKVWRIDFQTAAMTGLFFATAIYLLVRPVIEKTADRLPNSKVGVNSLFTAPLIFAAALLSFAHGANDVANAVGPLAAINEAISGSGIVQKAAVPLWVMMVGAFGIALGLALYGPRLIKTVGSEITELDQMRAFCIAMAAAITVIIATQFGLPVSSTHIAVGAVFGVGFLREFLKATYARTVEEIMSHHDGQDQVVVEAFLEEFRRASIARKGEMLTQLKAHSAEADLTKKERKGLRKIYRQQLVKRSALLKIVAAWLITVPVSGLLAATLFYAIRGFMLP